MKLYTIYTKLKESGYINRNIAIRIDELTDGKLSDLYPINSFTKQDSGFNYNETLRFLEDILKLKESIEINIPDLKSKFDTFIELVETLPNSLSLNSKVCHETFCIDIPLDRTEFINVLEILSSTNEKIKSLYNYIKDREFPEFSLIDGTDNRLLSLFNTIKTTDYRAEYKELLDNLSIKGNPFIPDRGNQLLIELLYSDVTYKVLEFYRTVNSHTINSKALITSEELTGEDLKTVTRFFRNAFKFNLDNKLAVLKEYRDNLDNMELSKKIKIPKPLTKDGLKKFYSIEKHIKEVMEYVERHSKPAFDAILLNKREEAKQLLKDSKQDFKKVLDLYNNLHKSLLYTTDIEKITAKEFFKQKSEIKKVIDTLERYYRVFYSKEFKELHSKIESVGNYNFSVRNDPIVKLLEKSEVTEVRERIYPVIEAEVKMLNTFIYITNKIYDAVDKLY